MEDSSLHGFKFKSQTPLVSDGDCARHAETEPGQCPPSPRYEALHPLPSSTYHNKAQQTPSEAHHSGHGRRVHYETIALGAARRFRASCRRLLESIDSDPTIADTYESDLVRHPSYSWTAQPTCSNVMDYDEVMCDGAGLESPETNDFSHGGCMDSQYSESGDSTVAMVDVCEDADEDMAVDFEDIHSFDSEDDNSLDLDFEGGNLFDFEDASSRQTDESSVEKSTDNEDEFESADDDDWDSEDEDNAESEPENEYPGLYMTPELAMEAFERTMKIIFGP
ncbi:hypothetical protein V8C42DRAFT_341792 [Trichoderma barbatum]